LATRGEKPSFLFLFIEQNKIFVQPVQIYKKQGSTMATTKKKISDDSHFPTILINTPDTLLAAG
jgi:hypothetical protein